MSRTNKTDVSKLLRVLVVGGVALAGVARAEEKAAEPAQKTMPADKDAAEKAKAVEKAKAAEQAKKEKDKKDADKKAAEPAGGGVKGW